MKRNIINKGLSKRLLEWAKEYGKHFCIHDVMQYFDTAPEGTLASTLTDLVKTNRLHKSYDINGCKMQPKRHHSYAYNQIQPPLKTRSEMMKEAYKKKKKTIAKPACIQLSKADNVAVCPHCKRKVVVILG